MGKSAYVKLVEKSTTQEVTLDDVKQKLKRYIEMTTKTGEQLDWNYADAAFPYTIEEKTDAEGQWFYLKGKDANLYKYIIMGVGTKTVNNDKNNVENDEQNGEQNDVHEEQAFIQIVIPDQATHGDVSKANEYAKFLAKEYQAELELFNGRIMYYYPRKP